MSAAADVEQEQPEELTADSASSRAQAVPVTDADVYSMPISLAALCVLVRTLWLTPVEIWGDAAQKWHFARQWAYHNDFSHADWSHHMARLGVNFPVFLLQRVLGTAAKVYYVVPVAAFTLQVVFVYLLARRLGGRAVGVFTALFLIFFPGLIRSSSQLLPDGIAGTVLVIAAYLWLRFHEAEGRARLYWLLGMSGAVVWAYAMKESNAFFFPAMALSVWVSRRSFKEAAILTAVVFCYGLLETAGFALFTPYSSRYAIVEVAPEYTPITFWQLFERYTHLEPIWQILLCLWVPSALWLSVAERRLKPLLIIPLTFLLLLTFLVRHLHPLAPWIGNKSRYLAVVAPFLVLGIGLFVGDVSRRMWDAYKTPLAERAVAFLRRDVPAWTLGLCVALGLLVAWHEGPERFSALHMLHDQAAVLNDAYRRNLPIVDSAKMPRALKTVYAVHLSDKYLAQADFATKGWLPDINEAVHKTKVDGHSLSYLLVNADAYGADDMAKLVASDCAVVVREIASVVRVTPRTKLPPSCKAPGKEPLPR